MRPAAIDTAERINAMLTNGSIGDIMDTGLHEFLEEFISRNNRLSMEISQGYRFNE